MKRVVLLSLVAVVFIGCQDSRSPTGPEFEGEPLFEISDGRHTVDGGPNNPHFYFLPPMVFRPRPRPSGEPDGDLDVVVRICLGKVLCEDGKEVDKLTTERNRNWLERIRFHRRRGNYFAFWRTRGENLQQGQIYRLNVLVGTALLGYADVRVVRRWREAIGVLFDQLDPDAEDFVPVRQRSWLLPISFRIETPAVCFALDPDFEEGEPCATASLEADEELELKKDGETVGIVKVDNAGTINMKLCTDLRDRPTPEEGRIDLRTFGDCIEITSLDEAPVSGIATLCRAFGEARAAGVSREQAARMTVHRFGEGDIGAVALPHSQGPACPTAAPEQALELNRLERFVRFARNTWRAVSDRVVAWIEPAPLFARTMVRCNRRGCSSTSPFRSSYQMALPSWMDALHGTDLGSHPPGTVLTVKVRTQDSGEPEGDGTPFPEPANDVRLTFTVDGGTPVDASPLRTGPAGGFENGIAEFQFTVGPGANSVGVSGIGVGTFELDGTTLNVFGPSINDPEGDDPAVELGVGTLEFTATGIQPDLIVFSLEHSPPAPEAGEEVTITAVVKNIGTAPAAASEVSIAVTGDVTPLTFTVDPLDPDATFEVVRVGEFAEGAYSVVATADAGETVPESDEGNNTEDASFTVTVVEDFHDLRRDGDIVIYKNYNAWFEGENKDETVLQADPFRFVSGTDYFVRSMSDLQVGIPDATSLIIVTSAGRGNQDNQITDQNAGAANLQAWVEAGGWLVIHAGDNAVDDYIVPGLSGPVDEDLNRSGLTLEVADHALIRGPDAVLGTGDDLTNDNMDHTIGFDNHGALSGLLPTGAEVLIVEQDLQVGQDLRRDVYATYTLGAGRVIVTSQTMERGGTPDRNLINHFYWAINGVDAGPAAPQPAIVADAAFDLAGGGEVLVNSDGTMRN